jgi:hypothetical protein
VIGISAREFARRTGRSEGGVRKAIKTKRISTLPDGSLDQETAEQEWVKNTFAGQTLTQAAAAVKPAMAAPAPVAAPVLAPPDAPPSADPVNAYLRARAIKENFAARKMQLEYEELAGKLIRAEHAAEYAATFSSLVREHLMAMPDRLSPMVAAMGSDENAIHKVFESEVAALLRKIGKAVSDAGL